MKMKNEFVLRNFLLIASLIYLHFIHIVVVDGQRSASLAHRLDVYIAGFFPYKEGAEKSETGKIHIHKYQSGYGFSLSLSNNGLFVIYRCKFALAFDG